MGILKKKTRKICKLPELAEAELASAEMKSLDDSSAPTSGRKRKKREIAMRLLAPPRHTLMVVGEKNGKGLQLSRMRSPLS